MSYQSLDDPTSDADSCSNTCNDAYNSTNKLDVGMNPLQRHDDERSSCYGMGGLGASSMDSTPTTMSHMLHDYWQQQYTEYQAQQQRIIAHDANSPRFSESTTTFAETKNSTTIDPESMIREARARAKLIVQRLGGTTTADDPGSTALEFTQQRIQALQLEEDRKRVYFNKNIAYATKIEQERLFVESQQAQQAQEWHAEYLLLLEQRQAAKLEQRKRAAEQLRESKLAGVGSQKQRTRNNREQRQVAGMPSKRSRGETSSQTATKTTVAVYVSGFPSDGSIDAEFLTALFSSYGSIRKAHLYRDRQTGRLKGDGLIIFEVSAAQGGEELILTVCEQVRECAIIGRGTDPVTKGLNLKVFMFFQRSFLSGMMNKTKFNF